MPRLTNSTPAYRRHSSGQAIVVLNGKHHYLGPHGTKVSRAEYDRLIGVWLSNGRALPGDDLTLPMLITRYWSHVQEYHRTESGHPGEISNTKSALRIVRKVAGDMPAAEFGPLLLKTAREQMVKAGWSRTYINHQVRRIVRMFKWAVANELVPAAVHQSLKAVEGLRRGKTTAPDHEPVAPVDAAVIEATLPFLASPVAAMVRLQMLTGMRPGEVCLMRPMDMDRSKPKLWAYTPRRHKTQHHGIRRTIYLGERCLEVIAPFLVDRAADAHLFSPAEAEAERFAKRSESRVTAAGQGNARGTNAVGRKRKREPGTAYDTQSYDHAIVGACDRAFLPPTPLGPKPGETKIKWGRRLTVDQRRELKEWRRDHRWSPNQIRHTFATDTRARHGLETAQVLLGHKTLTVTQVYAERNVAAAMAVMGREG